MRKSVWVTGSTGFTGRFMIRYLTSLAQPPHVIGIDVRPDTASQADESIVLDLTDQDSVRRAIDAGSPDVVIHLAGLLPPADEQAMMRVNVDASEALAKALSTGKSKTIRLVGAGSAAEYGSGNSRPDETDECKPGSPYGRSKNAQTRRLLSMNSEQLEVIVARPFNLLGPGLSDKLVAGSLLRQFREIAGKEGTIVPRGPVESIRDFVDVRDVVAAYWRLAMHGQPGEIYNVCTGHGTSVSRLIDIMQEELGISVTVTPDYDRSAISVDESVGRNGKLLALGWSPDYSTRDSVAAMVAATRDC